jgi:hypothetical protein
MRLSLADAICYALMVGCGEAYFVADGVRLGASELEVGLLAALPLCLGAIGPFTSLATLTRWRRRRPVVVLAAGGQAALLSLLAVAEATGLLTPLRLLLVACLYQVCGQGGGSAWASWYGDVVPARMRGRYFARRNRAAHLATCVAIAGSGLLLHLVEPGAAGLVHAGAGGQGYVIIFALAAACRVASCVLLALAPEPKLAPLPRITTILRHLRSPEGVPARRLLLGTGAMQLAVYIGSPYFAPYMLENLHLSYVEYTASTLVVVLAKSFGLSAWGRAIDRHGPRTVFLLATELIALLPLPWLFADGLGLIIAAQLLSGLGWGAYEVAHFSLLLENAEPPLRPHLFAVANAGNGLSQLTGTVLGGTLLSVTGRSFQAVFVATMAGRLAVALFVARAVRDRGRREPIHHRQLLFRILGFRASGGLAHRPLPVDADRDPPE